MNGWDWASLLIIIAVAITIVAYFMYNKKQRCDLVKKTPIIYANVESTIEKDSLVYRVANLGKIPGLLDANDYDVKVFGMAGELTSKIEKTPGKNYFDVVAPISLKEDQRLVVSYIGSVKYQSFSVSIDGGDTKYPLIFVDSELIGKKVESRMEGGK